MTALGRWLLAELYRFGKFLGVLLIITLEVIALLAGVIIAVDHNLVLGVIILVGLLYWMERRGQFA